MTGRLSNGPRQYMGLREATDAYAFERRRAGRRPVFILLRQERSWREVERPTDDELVRLKAVRDELRERGVRLPCHHRSR